MEMFLQFKRILLFLLFRISRSDEDLNTYFGNTFLC